MSTRDLSTDPEVRSRSTDPQGVESPGAELASARVARELSVKDVATALKLSRSIIEALEADRLDRIAPIYRRGYLINYARELGLDPERLLPQVTETEAPPLRDVLPRPAPTGRMDRVVRSASYLIATTLIVPPLVYFFVTGGTRLFDAPSEVAETAAPIATSDADSMSRRIARALSLDTETPDQQSGPLSASALPLTSLRSAETEQSVEASAVEPDPERTPLHQLEIELVEDSWVEINDAAGQRIEFDLLRAGERRSYAAMPPFRVLLGRANAVDIQLDGVPVRFEGDDRGSVAEFTLELPRSEPVEPQVGESSS